MPGYIYKVNGKKSTKSNSDYYSGTDTIWGNDIYGSAHKNGSTGPDKKFYNNSWWWIASPSAERNFGVCGISGNDSGVSNRGTYDCNNRLSLFAVVGV